jgi:hypothetical protein
MSDEPSPTDAYEARYMEGGAALARAKKRMPGWFFALLGLAGLSGLLATLVTGAPLLPSLLPALLSITATALVGVLFSHLRVVVTATHLHVQLGLFGPTIALRQITSVRTIPYDWKRFGGWGIRRSLDGAWCYSVPGGTGQCVEVEWTDDRGRSHKHVVSADNAGEIVAAVERQRAGATGVRVAADEAPATEAAEVTAEGATRGEEKRG